MKICGSKIGAKGGLALAVCALLGAAGCAHRELMAPCSDYKAAAYSPAVAQPGTIPCAQPLPLARPPWTAALAAPPDGAMGG